jgi:hypothetical protein
MPWSYVHLSFFLFLVEILSYPLKLSTGRSDHRVAVMVALHWRECLMAKGDAHSMPEEEPRLDRQDSHKREGKKQESSMLRKSLGDCRKFR